MKENLGASTNNVFTAESKVTFCGSEQTQQAANVVVGLVFNITSKLMRFEYGHPQYPNLSGADVPAFLKVADEVHILLYNDLQNAQAEFRKAAQTDLKLPLLVGDILNPLFGNPTPEGATAATAIPLPRPR